MKLIVVSICKDESATIGQVLDGIPTKIEGVSSIDKWVINDGSTDNTVEIAKKHGAKVLSDGMQKRLAWRFREALDLALGSGADILVNIDGDMQFNPADIPKIIKPIIDGSADFVAADRFTDESTGKVRHPANMPAAKYWGNKLGARVVSKLSNQNFKDVTCGFRAYNRDAMFSLNINGSYTYTQESFQVLAMKKMRIVAMPINVKYYDGRKSRVVKSLGQFVFGSALNILRAYRDYAPLSFFGTLGSAAFFPGLLLMLFDGGHWLRTGVFSPYKAEGLLGLYLFTIGLVIWALGLVADMLDRMLNNQEKIIRGQKEAKWGREK